MIHIRDAKDTLTFYWPDFIEDNGAVFLRQYFPNGGIDWLNFPDLTGAETFYNHVHLLDIFVHDAQIENDENNFWNRTHVDFKTASDVAKIVLKLWAKKLTDEYPNLEFRLYFCAHDDPTIRFHSVRIDEPVWLSETDWAEQLASEEIVIIDTRFLAKHTQPKT